VTPPSPSTFQIFPADYLAKFNIEPLHPDEFVHHQFGLDNASVIVAAQRCRARLKNRQKPQRNIWLRLTLKVFRRLLLSFANTGRLFNSERQFTIKSVSLPPTIDFPECEDAFRRQARRLLKNEAGISRIARRARRALRLPESIRPISPDRGAAGA
jgi:hypothetical protein